MFQTNYLRHQGTIALEALEHSMDICEVALARICGAKIRRSSRSIKVPNSSKVHSTEVLEERAVLDNIVFEDASFVGLFRRR